MSLANHDQEEFWTNNAGPTWVTYEGPLDAFLAPVLDGVIARAGLQPNQSVLDIGCGTGGSAVQAGRAVGPDGHVLAVDISATMVARARERTAQMPWTQIELADAADSPLKAAHFDYVISRFGVMFFADTQAAFENIGRAMKPGATLSFATWGQIPANPWFTLAAQIAKAELGAPPKTDPDAPGPFALRDLTKTCAMLDRAGFTDIDGSAESMQFTLPGGAADVAALSMHVGPAAGTIKHFDADLPAQARIQATMTDAFGQFDNHAIPAEINFFTARKS
ncbi:Methyltransferase domain-containing protein [Sulfitobacter marinus]|uniref:Methyltransferase domain-containing protein n=1 Tax=Sulfitobacter marinus TaxID=394264 RepID=A0A1I6QAW0_9RHOB|nr:class I SAM-dependent methyltransferase [Sulfitobacter marinus]SFS49542.1 Methyltransferase domain-containing protein [Sulfitobacter marinus]